MHLPNRGNKLVGKNAQKQGYAINKYLLEMINFIYCGLVKRSMNIVDLVITVFFSVKMVWKFCLNFNDYEI